MKMKTEAKHTPTPWHLAETPKGKTYITDNYVCVVGAGSVSIQDAAFIVRAVNAHDELVRAGKAILESLLRGEISWASTMGRDNLDDLKNAIAKAEANHA